MQLANQLFHAQIGASVASARARRQQQLERLVGMVAVLLEVERVAHARGFDHPAHRGLQCAIGIGPASK
jgi:hypothetical protein